MLFKQIQEYFKIRVFKKKNITYTLPFKRLRSERFWFLILKKSLMLTKIWQKISS